MWLLFATSTILSISVLVAYIVVLGNYGNHFPIPNATSSYFDSPYWVGIRRNNAIAISVFQIFAAVGYALWFSELLFHPPSTGLLKSPIWKSVSLVLFLGPSSLWPYAAHQVVLHPENVGYAILASSCLWISSVGVVLMIAGTFENVDARPPAIIGILCLGTVVVLADGIGWSAAAIYRTLY